MKELRRRVGLSQKQLGERIGVSQVYISKLEKGEITGLTIEKLVKLSSALKVTPTELLDILLNINNKRRIFYMPIGNNIARLRKEKSLTQKELAEKCNLSRSYLADLERDRYNPSLDSLKLVANGLGVSVSELLGESSHASSKDVPIDDLEQEFPEGIHILRRANKELSPESKKLMIKIMKAFLEDGNE